MVFLQVIATFGKLERGCLRESMIVYTQHFCVIMHCRSNFQLSDERNL